MSTALLCVHACMRAYVSACLGTSEVRVAGNECSVIGLLKTSVWRELARGSGAVIITKKRFVPDKKKFPCTCSYEGKVCA